MDETVTTVGVAVPSCVVVLPFEPSPYEAPSIPGTWPSTDPFPTPGPIWVESFTDPDVAFQMAA